MRKVQVSGYVPKVIDGEEYTKRVQVVFTEEDVDNLRKLVASQGPNERYFGAFVDLADRIDSILLEHDI